MEYLTDPGAIAGILLVVPFVLMQLKSSPEEAAEKWQRRTRAATEDYRRGIERVTTAPGEAAARNAEAALQNYAEAINSGKWQAAVRAVSLQDWQKAATTKGVQRIPQGVEEAAPKVRQVYQELFPAIEAARDAALRMPNITLEQRIERSTTFMREMHRRAPSRRGSST